jgi:hypothetical protein
MASDRNEIQRSAKKFTVTDWNHITEALNTNERKQNTVRTVTARMSNAAKLSSKAKI